MRPSPRIAPRRAPLLDRIRGLLIIIVVLYHALFDLTLFGVRVEPLLWSPAMRAVRFAGVSALLLLAGAVSGCTRSPLRRAVKLSACAAAVTAGTLAFVPAAPVLFGILHLFAVCTLLSAALSPLIRAVPPWVGAAGLWLAFALLYRLPSGLVGIGALSAPLPRALYGSLWLMPLGLPPAGFASIDYYPVLPWALLYLAGVCFAPAVAEGRLPEGFYAPPRSAAAAALDRLGRRTLPIYMLHQPVIMALLTLAAALGWV